MNKKTIAELEEQLEAASEEIKILKEQHEEKDEVITSLKTANENLQKKLELLESSVISKKLITECDGKRIEVLNDCRVADKVYSKEDLTKEEHHEVLRYLIKIDSGAIKVLDTAQEEQV